MVYNHLGRTENLIAATVSSLRDVENDLIGLMRVMPHANRLVPVRIERLTNILGGFDTVAVEQLNQLLQGDGYTLMQGRRSRRAISRHGALQIVEHGQQVANEGFFFCRCGLSGVAPGALFKIIKVSGETQILVFLFR
jgi:flagellar basal body rod protein FlgF